MKLFSNKKTETIKGRTGMGVMNLNGLDVWIKKTGGKFAVSMYKIADCVFLYKILEDGSIFKMDMSKPRECPSERLFDTIDEAYKRAYEVSRYGVR